MPLPHPRPRLLGADTTRGIATLRNVFGSTFDVLGEHSLEGTLRRLGEPLGRDRLRAALRRFARVRSAPVREGDAFRP